MSKGEEKTQDWIERKFNSDPDSKFLEWTRKALENGDIYPTYRDENGNVIPCPLDEWNARGGWAAFRGHSEKFLEEFKIKAIKDDEA